MHAAKIHIILTTKTYYKQFTCAALVLVADMLFYKHNAGWTLGLFGALLMLALAVHNKVQTSRHSTFALVAAIGLVLALIESPTPLAITMFGATAIAAALLTQHRIFADARVFAGNVLFYMFAGWFRLYLDNLVVAYVKKRAHMRHGKKRMFIRNWLLPLGLSTVFAMLFAQANPIITGWLEYINWWRAFSEYTAPERFVFWLFVACGCWAFIRPKIKQRKPRAPRFQLPMQEFTPTSLIFNDRSILTSLIMFNLLFLLQNSMDIAFLWSGVIPEGMTHAQYAHQGAYPLMVTALLAAAFVLIALKPGSATQQMPVIRALVYGWVGQNVFLVLSSILRLAEYVQVYSLTWLRVEAFIWMGLVALGLILIVARIYYNKTNRWLINTNSAALYATLYICCFMNFGGMIAQYNLSHCGTGALGEERAVCDLYYLKREVGVEAIPALREFEKNATFPEALRNMAESIRANLQTQLQYKQQDWRQWTFRNWRMNVEM